MPIGRVVGEFDVGTIHRDSLSRLWAKTSQFSGIDREYFYSYFDGLDTGYAIEIGDFRNYGKQLSPLEAYGINPPQSFAYIE
jgi:predicted transcriptional regulator